MKSFLLVDRQKIAVCCLIAKRYAGSVSSDGVIKKMSVGNSMVLRQTPKKVTPSPLVILYEWLAAKPAAVDKYCQLYHDHGMDVLTIGGSLPQFLQPTKGFVLARELLDYLGERRQSMEIETHPCESYLIHAFSIGAFNHTLCMMTSEKDLPKYGWFQKSICGSVFDSIVIGTLENMTSGMSLSISKSRAVQASIRALCMAYFWFNHKATVQFYDDAVDFFKRNPALAPTQFFFSYNDPMCDTETLEELLSQWRRDFPEMKVFVNSWEISTHAAHIKFHEAEYKSAMENLFSQLRT